MASRTTDRYPSLKSLDPLPVELRIHILDYLRNTSHKPTLATIARVSPELRKEATERLYYTVDLCADNVELFLYGLAGDSIQQLTAEEKELGWWHYKPGVMGFTASVAMRRYSLLRLVGYVRFHDLEALMECGKAIHALDWLGMKVAPRRWYEERGFSRITRLVLFPELDIFAPEGAFYLDQSFAVSLARRDHDEDDFVKTFGTLISRLVPRKGSFGVAHPAEGDFGPITRLVNLVMDRLWPRFVAFDDFDPSLINFVRSTNLLCVHVRMKDEASCQVDHLVGTLELIRRFSRGNRFEVPVLIAINNYYIPPHLINQTETFFNAIKEQARTFSPDLPMAIHLFRSKNRDQAQYDLFNQDMSKYVLRRDRVPALPSREHQEQEMGA